MAGKAYKENLITKHTESGQFISLNNGKLTEFASLFVGYYVKNGGQARAAFLQAGGSPEGVQAGVRHLMGSKKIREAIRQRQLQRMTGMASMAADTIKELMLADDGTVPPAVRFQAARWCMETAGVGPQQAAQAAKDDSPGDKPLEEMSIRELEAFITAGGQAVKAQRDQEARTINVTPDQADQEARTINVTPDQADQADQ